VQETELPLQVDLRALEYATGEVLKQLAHLGITPNPASRLPRAERCLSKCLRDSAGIMPSDHQEFERVCEAVRDVYMFKRILLHPVRKGGEKSLERLRTAASGGATTPLEESANTSARDAQAELFAAATLVAHGVDSVDLDEPDVVFRIAAQRFGVAVKRVKGESSVDDRVRKAADQVESSGRPGIVWLEGTRLINQPNQRIVKPCTEGEFAVIANRVLDYLNEEWRPRLVTMLADSNVIGVVINADIVRASHLPYPSVATLHSFHPMHPNARGYGSAWDCLYRRFRSGGTDLTGTKSDLPDWRRRHGQEGRSLAPSS